MWDICIMTWKTFLKLFKYDYSLFYYDGVDWKFKTTDIPIKLHFFNDIVDDDYIYFIDSFFNRLSYLNMEELNGKI